MVHSIDSHAIYSVIGIDKNGRKDLTGIYVFRSEDANFWLGILIDLQDRGVKNQKEILKDLKLVYAAVTKEKVETELDYLEEKWGELYPIVIKS